MQPHIQKIGELTLKFLHAKMNMQLKKIMNFWESLQTEELRLSVPKEHSVICKFLAPLQDIIYEAMCINEYENDETVVGDSFDDERYTVLEAASNTLLEMAKFLPQELFPRAWTYFNERIGKSTWQEQYQALVGINCVMKVENKQLIYQNIDPIYMSFWQLLDQVTNQNNSRMALQIIGVIRNMF